VSPSSRGLWSGHLLLSNPLETLYITPCVSAAHLAAVDVTAERDLRLRFGQAQVAAAVVLLTHELVRHHHLPPRRSHVSES
jgi:hypothetical protein